MTKVYEVSYIAYYYVEADDEDEAIELAIEEHENLPDGSWQVESVEEVK
jgi:hypothetical protein